MQKEKTGREAVERLSFDATRGLESYKGVAQDGDMVVLNVRGGARLAGRSLWPAFLTFAYCRRGSARLAVNDREVGLAAGDLLIAVGESRYDLLGLSPDFEARLVVVSQHFAQECVAGLYHLWRYLFALFYSPVLHLDAAEKAWLGHTYAGLLRRIVRGRGHLYRREAAMAFMRMTIYDICDLLGRRHRELPQASSRAYSTFDEFLRLVAAHFTEHRDVAWYGCRLCITPKYLSELVKSVSGRSAGYWITLFIVLEAKSLLQDGSLSVKEVAARLGFSNQSFFGKYFKNAAGLSPAEYRRAR